MMRRILFLALLTLCMNACTAYRNDSLQRMRTLPEHYSQFDAKLAWEVTSTGDSTVINGVVQNIRYFEMTDLEVWVYSLDDKGKEVHRGMDFVYRLKETEAEPFSIRIPRVAPGSSLRFLYRYVGLNGDGGEGSDAVYWTQSFVSKVP